jgi:phage terminase large subunit-like protein
MGGGKTWASLIDNLQGVHDPNYFSVFFRTTTVEVDKGLWPSAKNMYMPYLVDQNGKLKGKAHISEKMKTITWPSGARTTFTYLDSDKAADSWYGSEITKIYFEEAQFRSAYQFEVLKSRNRSMASVPKGIRCTLNPSPTSFIYEWVEPFLDEDKYPIPELSGKTRYYTQLDGRLITSWDADEIRQQTGKEPETYTYIPATLSDNQKLEELDPTYRNKLDAMPEAKRKQLLLGCWASTDEDGLYFRREYLKKTNHVPLNSKYCRGWDLAASAGDTPNTAGCDATHGLKMARCPQGYFYICGSRRFRKRAGERDQEILLTARQDGDDVYVVIPKDTGAGGAAQFEYLSKLLITEGFKVKKDDAVATTSKLKKASPFFSACENGLVYIVEDSFEKDELELFYRELEIFDGVTRSTRLRHDESVDTAATCFNFLSKQQVIPTIVMPTLTKSNEFAF